MEKYVDSKGNDITHIYSYNKVMAKHDKIEISKILNRTNFRLLSWYFGPKESASCGLKRVKLAFKIPMQSTGREKFSVYTYFKTELYDPNNPWSDDESECSFDESSSHDEQKQESAKT
jgi:hypothetical protein